MMTACNDRPLGDTTSHVSVWDVPTSNDGKPGGLSVPDGWRLVPEEPTEDMMKNATARNCGGFTFARVPSDEHDEFTATFYPERIWQAMLAAAPQPPKENEK